MISTCLAWDDVINVHLTLICLADLAYPAITAEHALTLLSVSSAV
jgi:hypothetical protein